MNFKNIKKLFFSTLVIVFLGGLATSAFAQEQGSVCLAPGDFDAFSKGAATIEEYHEHEKNPESDTQPESIRFVQIDKLPPVKVTSSKSGKITGVNVTGKHLIKISKRSDMKAPAATFRFSFDEKHSNRLCLWYRSFYASWMLQPQKGSVCRCE